jgi:hypothetical protein
MCCLRQLQNLKWQCETVVHCWKRNGPQHNDWRILTTWRCGPSRDAPNVGQNFKISFLTVC